MNYDIPYKEYSNKYLKNGSFQTAPVEAAITLTFMACFPANSVSSNLSFTSNNNIRKSIKLCNKIVYRKTDGDKILISKTQTFSEVKTTSYFTIC